MKLSNTIDAEKLNALIEINTLINSNYTDVTALLAHILESAMRLVDGEASSILLVDTNRKYLRFEVALGPKGLDAKKLVVKLDEGIAGWVVKNNRSLIVNDTAHDPRYSPLVQQSTGYKTQNMIAVPMRVKDECIGVIEILNKGSEREFCLADLEVLEILANQAAIAYQNASVLQRSRDEIVVLQDQIATDRGYHTMIARSPVILEKLDIVERVAKSDSSVLILGESGVGKELFAEQLHLKSGSPRDCRVRARIRPAKRRVRSGLHGAPPSGRPTGCRGYAGPQRARRVGSWWAARSWRAQACSARKGEEPPGRSGSWLGPRWSGGNPCPTGRSRARDRLRGITQGDDHFRIDGLVPRIASLRPQAGEFALVVDKGFEKAAQSDECSSHGTPGFGRVRSRPCRQMARAVDGFCPSVEQASKSLRRIRRSRLERSGERFEIGARRGGFAGSGDQRQGRIDPGGDSRCESLAPSCRTGRGRRRWRCVETAIDEPAQGIALASQASRLGTHRGEAFLALAAPLGMPYGISRSKTSLLIGLSPETLRFAHDIVGSLRGNHKRPEGDQKQGSTADHGTIQSTFLGHTRHDHTKRR